MSTATAPRTIDEQWSAQQILALVVIVGIAVPLIGTLLLNRYSPDWTWLSLPFHSTLEVSGAILGLVLAMLILFTKQTASTTRRLWISLALISITVFDIFHSCVPAGNLFVWFHNLAVLAGGLFFSMVWFKDREISRRASAGSAFAVFVGSVLVGTFSSFFPDSVPAMFNTSGFSSESHIITIIGGVLTLFAGFFFARAYLRTMNREDLLFLILCLLFGGAGIFFHSSSLGKAEWWFWHLLRFGAYFFAFILAFLSYRNTENEILRVNDELDDLFHVAVDGKRLIDRQFNQQRLNDTFIAISGIERETADGLKCHEVFHSHLCHTDECPIRRFESGFQGVIEQEVTKTRMDGQEVSCLMKATRLNAADGSFRGIVESFFDISEQKRAEEAGSMQTLILNAINQVFSIAMTSETEEQLARETLRVAEELTGSRFGFIGETNEAGLMDTIAISNPGWEACDIVVSDVKNFITNMPLRGIDRSALKDGKSRIVNADQIANHPDHVAIPPGHPPITSFLGVPFKINEKTAGMIGLANKEGGYTSTDQEAIEALSTAFYETLVRKRMETRTQDQAQALRQLSSELELIIDSIPGLVFYKDTNNRYLRVNKYVADAHNLKKSELEGTSLFDLYPAEHAQAYLDDDLKVVNSRIPKLNYEEVWITDAGERWVSTSKIPYIDEKGNVIGVIGVSMDITARKQSELEVRAKSELLERQDWVKTGIARINEAIIGNPDMETLASRAITEIANYLHVQMGALYITQPGNPPVLFLTGSYAYTKRKNLSNKFALGEGLVGQAALEKKQILLKNVPEDYIRVTSGLGDKVPSFICITPFMNEDRVKGVIEVATLYEIDDLHMEYLTQAMPTLAIAVESAESRTRLSRALEESQALSEELQTQQEELRTTNEELEEQTMALRLSEEKLRIQQEELQVTNEELEEKNELLNRQKREVEQARKDIEEKAEELALASKYKSEFLANMSHELRTPLNSLLILSQSLSDNKGGNLTAEQVESAQVIYSGGNDLLNLINEILDLSKIEAGRMDLNLGGVKVADLADGILTSFQHQVHMKGLTLTVVVSPDAPDEIVSDRHRIEQVLKNLIANALKFTESGSVSTTFFRPDSDVNLTRSGLAADRCLAIEVRDTGIGISREQQKIVFEAFQQADGGITRRFGGTGLGLSISRELARLLGGEIQLESEPDIGSTFTLYLPLEHGTGNAVLKKKKGHAQASEVRIPRSASESEPRSIQDDRADLTPSDRIIMVIEDDPNFARILLHTCHEKGFKCLAAATGEEGLTLVSKYLPRAVLLDLKLPGMDGWAVLASLKEDTRTRHIPVHIISVEEASSEALRKGAVGYATKPVSMIELDEAFKKIEDVFERKMKSVLVVEDDNDARRSIVELITADGVQVVEAVSAKQAGELLRSRQFDCIILDLGLWDMDGDQLLKSLEKDKVDVPPVIVYTARDLTREEEMEVRQYADSIILKDVRSQERLLDEVSLFLHQVVSQMPEKKKQIIMDLHNADTLLRDKKILIVDDDMRTTFAMSKLLADKGLKTLKADNGKRAITLLEQEPDVDLVLMDIMMPVMDGYEAMKAIRAQERFRRLPIIALTAKAMKEDREKCLECGANDYLSKPVDMNKLLSMMRVWLYR